MNENIINEPTTKELERRVIKLEDGQEKILEKIDTNAKETTIDISTLRENQNESRLMQRQILEQVSDLKALFKTNNESNFNAIISMVKNNTAALLKSNESNLSQTRMNSEIDKDIKISHDSTQRDIQVNKDKVTIQLSKGKIAIIVALISFFGIVIPIILQLVFHI